VLECAYTVEVGVHFDALELLDRNEDAESFHGKSVCTAYARRLSKVSSEM
jgi:hypothetical protein